MPGTGRALQLSFTLRAVIPPGRMGSCGTRGVGSFHCLRQPELSSQGRPRCAAVEQGEAPFAPRGGWSSQPHRFHHPPLTPDAPLHQNQISCPSEPRVQAEFEAQLCSDASVASEMSPPLLSHQGWVRAGAEPHALSIGEMLGVPGIFTLLEFLQHQLHLWGVREVSGPKECMTPEGPTGQKGPRACGRRGCQAEGRAHAKALRWDQGPAKRPWGRRRGGAV